MNKLIEICSFSLVLCGLMICGLFLTSTLSCVPADGAAKQWIIFTGQNILAFILPSILTWKICFRNIGSGGIGMKVTPSALMICAAVTVYAVGIPALNQVVYWNQEIHLPESLSSMEEWFRAMELAAEEQTSSMLAGTQLSHLLVNIGVIGILTGIGEEFFFRGALQKMLIRCEINPHTSIWTSAVIFSLLHFQFYGFVPRILLGAWFGYLYWWSGSIWVSSFAHALNNTLVILSAWLIKKGTIGSEFDMLGVSTGNSFPWPATISAIAVAALLYLLHREMRKTQTLTYEKATESKI